MRLLEDWKGIEVVGSRGCPATNMIISSPCHSHTMVYYTIFRHVSRRYALPLTMYRCSMSAVAGSHIRVDAAPLLFQQEKGTVICG